MMKKLNHSLLFALVVLLSACQPKKAADPTKSSSATSPAPVVAQPDPNPVAPPENTGDPTTIAALPTTMGVRNFDQINATMESLTGVTGNKDVIQRFKMLTNQLPADNDIKSFAFSSQGAITVLAAEYCNALIQNKNGQYASQLMATIGNFNLGAGPATAFAGNNMAMLSQNLVMKFWSSSYANNPNATAAVQSVTNLIKTLIDKQTNNSTTTKNAVIGACTSVLASAPVSTY